MSAMPPHSANFRLASFNDWFDNQRVLIGRPLDYGVAALNILCLILLAIPFRQHLRVDVLALASLTSIVLIAARQGMGPAIAGSFLSVLAINFFFIAPYYTLRISDPYEWITLGLLLLSSLIVGSLTAQLSIHAKQARLGETQARLLYSLNKTLSEQGDDESIMDRAADIISSVFDVEARFIKPIEAQGDTLPNDADGLALKQALSHAKITGRNSETLAKALQVYVPIRIGDQVFAVLTMAPHDAQRAFSATDLMLFKASAEVISNSINLRRNRDLAYEAKALHEHEQFRTVLLSSLSHDLRTPLTLMNASLSTLLRQRKALPRPIFDEITALWTRLSNLQTFVSNLLRIAALTSGQMKLNFEAVSLTEILGAVYEQFKAQKGNRLMATQIKGQIPLIKADGALIEQVFVNLLGNAIKHTQDNGHITLIIEPSGPYVRVCVQDDGDGIPKGQEEAIFTRFLTLGDTSADRQNRPTGLGLAICRHIILAHEGTIYAYNHPKDSGASFVFTLPVWARS